MDQEDDEDDSKRNLAVHLGIVSDSKREKAIQTYNDDIEEFEEMTYGKDHHHLKFGYSNSLSVLSYLVRVEPYSSIFIDQNGKLDNPNRMISDVYESWSKVCESTQCNSELSPEWFYLPRIFMNKNYIDFGSRTVHDKNYLENV